MFWDQQRVTGEAGAALRRERGAKRPQVLQKVLRNPPHCVKTRRTRYTARPCAHITGREATDSGGSMSGSILYIHGFNSSPLSKKARQLEAVMQQLGLPEQLRVPALHQFSGAQPASADVVVSAS